MPYQKLTGWQGALQSLFGGLGQGMSEYWQAQREMQEYIRRLQMQAMIQQAMNQPSPLEMAKEQAWMNLYRTDPDLFQKTITGTYEKPKPEPIPYQDFMPVPTPEFKQFGWQEPEAEMEMGLRGPQTAPVKISPTQLTELKQSLGILPKVSAPRELTQQERYRQELKLLKRQWEMGPRPKEVQEDIDFLESQLKMGEAPAKPLTPANKTLINNAYRTFQEKYEEQVGTKSPLTKEQWYLQEYGEELPWGVEEEMETKEFYGAKSYREVEEAVKDIPEPKKSQILKQAKEFFGVQ